MKSDQDQEAAQKYVGNLFMFGCYFGIWPEKDVHLRGLIRSRYVEPKLREYAEKLNNAYITQRGLLEQIRAGELKLREAKKRLSRSYRNVQRAEERFYGAQTVAFVFDFAQRLTFNAYLVPVAQAVDEPEAHGGGTADL